MIPLRAYILRTLLYYDIWNYPLKSPELFAFLPVNSMTYHDFVRGLNTELESGDILEHRGYYFVRGKTAAVVDQRVRKERHASRLWRAARVVTHFIKRVPFVRGVFISGDLSKNAANPGSDLDFFIVTEPGRLWITRTLLIAFKKVFLFNRKRFFCLNYFATTDCPTLETRNLFVATEIAHLKPLHNSALCMEFLRTNNWIKEFFPNFRIADIHFPAVHDRKSHVQRVIERMISVLPLDRIDDELLRMMERVWARRYPEYDKTTRDRIFRCSKTESRAYVGNYEEKILALYRDRLRTFSVET
jgi:hypothetical protein